MFSPALAIELWRWRDAGHMARLWWRDDDATEPTPKLDRLLALARETLVPLALAVVPKGDMAGLAARLQGAGGLTVIQHGVDHLNRRLGPVAGEFPHGLGEEALADAMLCGWDRLRALPAVMAVYAPPWHDIHPNLGTALAGGGYLGFSAFGAIGGAGGLPRVDAHLDLLRWRGRGARFRGEGRVLASLAAELRRRRKAGLWDAPIGLLSHHLAHDEAAWRFLRAFLKWSLSRRELAWVALPTALREAQAFARQPPPAATAVATDARGFGYARAS